jgi:hypothetical protein
MDTTNLKTISKRFLAGGSYKRRVSCNNDQVILAEFILKELYFILWYPDQENQEEQSGLFLVPESVVFVGMNLEGDETRDTWYFQDTKSYCAYGGYPNNEGTGLEPDDYYGCLYTLHREDLFQIVDCRGLIAAASECINRRLRS